MMQHIQHGIGLLQGWDMLFLIAWVLCTPRVIVKVLKLRSGLH